MTLVHSIMFYIIPALHAATGGVETVTVQYHSARKANDRHDGNARDAGFRAICSALCNTADGRSLLALAAEGELGAVSALFHSASGRTGADGKPVPAENMFKRPADAWEAQHAWRTGKGLRPDAQPDAIFHATMALARYAKAEAAKAEAKAKAEAASAPPVQTCALPPADAKPTKASRKAKAKPTK